MTTTTISAFKLRTKIEFRQSFLAKRLCLSFSPSLPCTRESLILPRCKVGGGRGEEEEWKRQEEEGKREKSIFSFLIQMEKKPSHISPFSMSPSWKTTAVFSGTTCVFRLCSSHIQRVSYASIPFELGEEGEIGEERFFLFPFPVKFSSRGLSGERKYTGCHMRKRGQVRAVSSLLEKKKPFSPSYQPSLRGREGGESRHWGLKVGRSRERQNGC